MQNLKLPFFAICALALGLTACDGANKPSATASPPQENGAKSGGKVAAAGGGDAADPKPTGEKVAQGGGDKVKVVEGKPPGQDERYELVFDTPDATAGQESKVTVRVVPKEPWHMNLDYPTSLAVDAPSGVSLSKAKLKKGDAKKLDEESCEFDVAFTAANPGDQTLTGQFKFAVCQDEACSPVTEAVEMKVAVK